MTPHEASAARAVSADAGVARVRGPGDLAAAVPVLLGFHPQQSLVVIALAPPPQQYVVLTMRADLPALTATVGWRSLAEQVRLGAERAGGAAALLVLYTDDSVLAEPAKQVVGRALRRAGLELLDVLRVHDGRYYGMLCRNTRCCPPAGLPVPVDAPIQAFGVVQGRAVRPGRDDLAAEIAPPSDGSLRAAEQAIDQAVAAVALDGAGEVEAMAGELDAALAQAREGGLSPERAARLAVLVTDGDRRDEVYRHLTGGSARVHRDLWAAVCRAIPPDASVVPLMLFALAAYLDGDGAVANVAAERAAAWQPDHPTVRLFADIVTCAVPPHEVLGALAHAVQRGR
jgi:hypothetical protein